jgi:small subunit ribosomal protein S1
MPRNIHFFKSFIFLSHLITTIAKFQRLLYHPITMKDLLDKYNSMKSLKTGEIIEGTIVGKSRSAVYLDLGVFGTGIIFGKEYQVAKEVLRKIKFGEKIFAKITGHENDEGYIELSANEAGQEFAWNELQEKKDKSEIVKVKILGANKGGLLTKVMGIPAFLPVSQLSSKNYPKVEGGDTGKILRELQKFIGQEIDVRVLDFSKKEEKLIVSEKIKEVEKTKELLKKYKVGDVIEVEITGTADFGAFVSFGENIEGLIHISEIAWQIIKDPSEIVKEGEKVSAKIIEIAGDRAFLSLKALKDDPWDKIKGKYNKGDVVKGKVSKINPFGAFIQIISDNQEEEDKVQGLCHVSEFETVEKMNEKMVMDQEYSFEILLIEPEEHRMILRLKD